jgi:hypothetical protein
MCGWVERPTFAKRTPAAYVAYVARDRASFASIGPSPGRQVRQVAGLIRRALGPRVVGPSDGSVRNRTVSEPVATWSLVASNGHSRLAGWLEPDGDMSAWMRVRLEHRLPDERRWEATAEVRHLPVHRTTLHDLLATDGAARAYAPSRPRGVSD